MGFLAADGCFRDNGTFAIASSEKDLEHLMKFSEYIQYKNKVSKGFTRSIITPQLEYANYSINVGGIFDFICGVQSKFDLKPRKTYSPPNIEFYRNFTNEQLMAYFIGFVDGDGTIQNPKKNAYSCIVVQCHISWMDFFSGINALVLGGTGTVRESQGKAKLHLGNQIFVKKLKRFVVDMSLPVLSRKWDKIDVDVVLRRELFERRFEAFKVVYSKDKKIKEISEEIGVTPFIVSNYIKLLKKDLPYIND